MALPHKSHSSMGRKRTPTQQAGRVTPPVANKSKPICPTGHILKALAFAANKHRDQRRKDAIGTPYINHPIALADMLCNYAGVTDEVVLCAALLHDTVEDTQTTHDELVAHFGKAIADVVAEVTDDKSLPKANRKRLQVENAAHASDQAKLVKLADKISNLSDIANSPPVDWDLERKQKYFKWAKRVVDQIRGINPALERLFDELHEKGV